jgi:hypothetical protein
MFDGKTNWQDDTTRIHFETCSYRGIQVESLNINWVLKKNCTNI